MSYQRKTIDLWDIEGRYSDGWEVLCTETSRKDARENLKAYREAEPGIAFRIRKYRARMEAVPA